MGVSSSLDDSDEEEDEESPPQNLDAMVAIPLQKKV